MFKKYLTLTVFSLNFVILSNSATAAESKIALCNNCDYRAMKTQAIKTAPEGGKVHVIDIMGDNIRAFKIEREYDLVMVRSSTVSSMIEQGVKEVKTTINQLNDMAQRNIDIQHLEPYLGGYASVITSAYDIAQKERYRFEVADAISSYIQDTIAGSVGLAAGSLGIQIINTVLPVSLAIKVKFPNDTTYEFIFKGLKTTDGKNFTAIIVTTAQSGKDGDIKIPDNGNFDGYIGVIEGSEPLGRLIEYMRLNGVQITNQMGGNTVTLICDDMKTCGAVAE